jgi:hypothetical protein
MSAIIDAIKMSKKMIQKSPPKVRAAMIKREMAPNMIELNKKLPGLYTKPFFMQSAAVF